MQLSVTPWAREVGVPLLDRQREMQVPQSDTGREVRVAMRVC